MLRARSFRAVAGPTYKSASTGSGQTSSRKFSGEMTVVASGFLRSLPSLANTLLNDTPTDSVSPSSSFTRRLSSPAIAVPLIGWPVTSSHASSSPNGSTRSAYSAYI